MSGFSNIVKNGWHPDKDKPIKKQAIGLFKKDDNTAYNNALSHSSRPLSSLRDPASFGPPPRHVALSGSGGAGSSISTASRSRSPPGGPRAESTSRPPSLPSRPALPPSLPARPGGASSSRSSSIRDAAAAASPERRRSADDDDDGAPRAPRTYRVDTTGLDTAHLPPPPTRRDGASPAPASTGRAPLPTPPSLPPRLPARSTPPTPGGLTAARPPPPLPARLGSSAGSSRAGSVSPVRGGSHNNDKNPDSGNLINQAAVQRLGRAGIVVPGLGIGPSAADTGAGAAPPQKPTTALAAIGSVAAARESSPDRPPVSTASPQISELQARLAKMGTAGSPAKPTPSALAAKKKPPPPPPPKKPDALRRPHGAATGGTQTDKRDDDDDDDSPPPIPMATRPQGW